MAVFLPSDSAQSDTAPWEILLREFRDGGKTAKERFAQIQKDGHDTRGFVIGGWDDEGILKWWYWGNAHDPWAAIDDDRRSQIPFIYLRLSDILKKVESLKEYCFSSDYHQTPIAHIGLVYWIHPEAHYQPLDRYIRLTEGKRFPGSPSQ